ncbi:Dual specificity protein kinase CLK2 [Fasciola gigantica]|uniref:Dual specificity protein kinase CLK2 n=1 Tax=Fasciola gigantica TaxID=46835 RepID=A0A504YJV5_FASGI|nr:Dual specificity protein kinase CLK2 [Fasciola gigantica]
MMSAATNSSPPAGMSSLKNVSHHQCHRSRSNHRCCYNSRYRNKQTRHVSDSTVSSSVSSSSDGKRKRSSSTEKTSSGYGCSDPKFPRTEHSHKRRRRSSHVSHHKSNHTAGAYKTVRLRDDEAWSRDSSNHSFRSGIRRSRATKPSNAKPSRATGRRSRSGYDSRGHSPCGSLRNGRHPDSPKRSERVDGVRVRREKRAQKRREEKARRKQSHEGHKRKPSPIVSVGDVIKRRYRVQKILGEGSYGQVFECFDLCTNSLTAVKALKPQDDYRDVAKHEVSVLDNVSKLDSKNASHCISSFDFFDWHNYFFLVFPLLGPSVFTFLEQNNYQPYPVEHAAAITRQLCEAVEFLHRIGLTHTDIKPENVLFVDGAFDELYDGDRCRMIRRVRNPAVKLIDFGSATYDDDHRPTTIQTRHYRAPEVVLELGWDHSADVWSIGCMLFELVTGQCLFMTHDNLEHLAMMERVLGPLPKYMVRSTKRRRYFRHGRLDWPSDSSDARHVRKTLKPLGDYWFSHSDMHVRLALDLTREMLVYTPSDRISCARALEHPFILSFES